MGADSNSGPTPEQLKQLLSEARIGHLRVLGEFDGLQAKIEHQNWILVRLIQSVDQIKTTLASDELASRKLRLIEESLSWIIATG